MSYFRTGAGFFGPVAAALHRLLAFGALAGVRARLARRPAPASTGPDRMKSTGRHVEIDTLAGEMRLRGLTKEEVEGMLDWLEANGYQDRDLCHADGRGFIVRWRPR